MNESHLRGAYANSMMRLLSQEKASKWPPAEVRVAIRIWACIFWLAGAQTVCSQTPSTLTPPRASVDQLSPPKTVPATLSPPKSAVVPLSPPKTTTLTTVAPPSTAGGLQPSVLVPPAPAPTSQLEIEQMAPAIAAVRTQLEILQPPPPTVQTKAVEPPRQAIEPQPSGLTLNGPEMGRGQVSRPTLEMAPVSRIATLAPQSRPTLPTASLVAGSSAPQDASQNIIIQNTVQNPLQNSAQSSIINVPSSVQPLPAPADIRRSSVLQPPPSSAIVQQLPSPPVPTPSNVPPGPQPTFQPRPSGPQSIAQSPTPSQYTPQQLSPQFQPQAQPQFQPQIQPQFQPQFQQQVQQQVQQQRLQPGPQLQVAPVPMAPTIEPPANGIVVLPAPSLNAPEQSSAGQVETLGQSILSAESPSNAEPVWQFNFQNAPWPLVIRNFAKQNGFALQMMAEPTGQFNFVDERPYPASEALDLLNDYLLNEGFLLIRNGHKLTTVSAGAPVQEGIVPFVPMRQVDELGRNELASVAIPIRSTDAAMVMSEIQPLLSRIGRAQVVSNSSRLVVTDTGAYLRRARDIIGGYGIAASDLQTVVVHLKNTTAENMAATLSAHLGISFGAASVTTAAGQAGAGGVVQASAVSASATGLSSTRVIPDRETNSLLLSGTPAEVADIQSLICQLDQARAQVILQGLILEVNLGNLNELGAEIGLQDSVLFNRSVIDNLVTLQQTNTAPNGVQTTSQQVISQTSAPGFNFNNQPLGNNTAISPNVLGAQGLGNLGVGRTNSQLGFGGLVLSASSNSVSLLLRALQANFQVDVLSRPQIRTVDNKEAFIQIGQQVPVVDGVNVTAVGTANPIIRQDQAGIILKMTPNVSPDGLIQIKVSAEKSAFKLQPGTGVPIFTDARNGTVIQAPIKDITTAQATVSARAGQTIVLGGMITRDEETIERRVPGLSRIPLLGRLFRYDYNNVTRKELLIFLTPYIIADDAASDAYKDVEVNRIHAPLERAAEIHGPLLTAPPEDEAIIQQVITSD